MLDLHELADRLAEYKLDLERREATTDPNIDPDLVLRLHSQLREQNAALDALRRERKEVSKNRNQTEESREHARALRAAEADRSAQVNELQQRLDEAHSWLPNYLDPRVPTGDEAAATVVRESDAKLLRTTFDNGAAIESHDTLAKRIGVLETDRATKLAGARFYSLLDRGIRLRMAMTHLFLDIVDGQGFQLISPPVLARRDSFFASGYLPFAASDNFAVQDSDLHLTGTSEQAILGMHQNEILDDVPLKYLGESMCFRTEAGSYGRDTKGMLRVHQFFKLEQFVFCPPEQSEGLHRQCQDNEERFVEALNIPSRTIICSSGDVAAPGFFKNDLEGWFPSQGAFRELTSNTNLTDFQSRRARTRVRIDGRSVFPHTISATGFCDRHIAALIENNVQSDGSVKLPDALIPYYPGPSTLEPTTQ